MPWPTLSRRPLTENVTINENEFKHQTEDPVSRGYRRRRYTRDTRKFSLSYDLMSEADYNLIKALFDAEGTVGSFSFLAKDGQTYQVVFAKPIQYVETIPGWYKLETIELEEI